MFPIPVIRAFQGHLPFPPSVCADRLFRLFLLKTPSASPSSSSPKLPQLQPPPLFSTTRPPAPSAAQHHRHARIAFVPWDNQQTLFSFALISTAQVAAQAQLFTTMATPPAVDRLARTWMVPEDSVSIFSAANMADEIRRKHNAFVQAVVTKVSNLEKEVKRAGPLGARDLDEADEPEAPSVRPLPPLGPRPEFEPNLAVARRSRKNLCARVKGRRAQGGE